MLEVILETGSQGLSLGRDFEYILYRFKGEVDHQKIPTDSDFIKMKSLTYRDDPKAKHVKKMCFLTLKGITEIILGEIKERVLTSHRFSKKGLKQ